jgi:parallel beta-helix repeat protein
MESMIRYIALVLVLSAALCSPAWAAAPPPHLSSLGSAPVENPNAQVVLVKGTKLQVGLISSLGAATNVTATGFTWTVILVAGQETLTVRNPDGRKSNILTFTVGAAVVAPPPPPPDPVESDYGPQATILCPVDAIQVLRGASIPDAVNGQPAGSSFCVMAGIHSPTVSIRLKAGDTLTGEYGAVIDGAQMVSGTEIVSGWNCADCSAVTVRNLTVRNLSAHACVGAYGPNANTWTVDHNNLYGCRDGVNFGIGAGLVITNNLIHHNSLFGYGISLTAHSRIEHNEFSYNGDQTKILLSTDSVFRDNWIHHSVNGIWYDGENTGILIEDNLVEDNSGVGIVYEISGRAIMRRNTVRRSGDTAIFISTSHDVDIYENTLEDNFRSITYLVYGPVLTQPTELGETFALQNVSAHDNVISLGVRTGSLMTGLTSVSLDATAFAPYVNGAHNLTFTNNTYRLPVLGADPWFWPGAMTWQQWQAVGHDVTGTIQ